MVPKSPNLNPKIVSKSTNLNLVPEVGYTILLEPPVDDLSIYTRLWEPPLDDLSIYTRLLEPPVDDLSIYTRLLGVGCSAPLPLGSPRTRLGWARLGSARLTWACKYIAYSDKSCIGVFRSLVYSEESSTWAFRYIAYSDKSCIGEWSAMHFCR